MKDNGKVCGKWRMMINSMRSKLTPQSCSKDSSEDEDTQYYAPSSRMGKKREEKKRRANKRVLLNKLKELLQYDTNRLRDTDILRLTITTIILSKYMEPYDNDIVEDIEKRLHMKEFAPIFFHMIVDLSTGSFREGKIIYICRFVERILEYKREDMLGYQVGHFLHSSFPQPLVHVPEVAYPNRSEIKPFKCIMKKKALTKNELDLEGVSLKISGFVFQRKDSVNGPETTTPACALMAEAHVFPDGFHSIVPLNEINSDLFLLDCLIEGEVRSADHRISTSLGLSPTTIRNTNILDHVKDEDKDHLKRALKLVSLLGYCKVVCRIRNRNGDYQPVECDASLQPNVRSPPLNNMLIKVQMISQSSFEEQYQKQEETLKSIEQHACQEWPTHQPNPSSFQSNFQGMWSEQPSFESGTSGQTSSGNFSYPHPISANEEPTRTFYCGGTVEKTVPSYPSSAASLAHHHLPLQPPPPHPTYDPSQLHQPLSHYSGPSQGFMSQLMPQTHQSISFYSRAFHPYWPNRRQDHELQGYRDPYLHGHSSYL